MVIELLSVISFVLASITIKPMLGIALNSLSTIFATSFIIDVPKITRSSNFPSRVLEFIECLLAATQFYLQMLQISPL